MGHWPNVGREGEVGGPQGGIYQTVSALTQELNTDTPKPPMTETPALRAEFPDGTASPHRGLRPSPETPSCSDFKDRCPCPVQAGPQADPRSRASLLWPPPACWFSDPDEMPWGSPGTLPSATSHLWMGIEGHLHFLISALYPNFLQSECITLPILKK